jgi:cytochrome c oxidase cbb3-type subunit 3
MTSGWSLYVIILTVLNIAACVWLLRWTAKPKSANEKIGGGVDTGHVWDSDLREYNNPLPRWWLWVFYLSVVFAIIYLVLYPGLGNFAGMKGWTQTGQYQSEKAVAEQKAAEMMAPFAAMSVQQLASDPQAMSTAHNLFQNNCAQCHGSDGGGARGFPNLSDASWQWGGDADTIVQTITGGRTAVMPEWSEVLGPDGVKEAVAYVLSISGQASDAALASAGKTRFDTVCAACHGLDGKGNALLGAPNLTDDIWLYGGDSDAIHESLVSGRMGQMPAFGDKLGEQRIRLLAAYVMRLSAGGGDGNGG